MANKLPSKKYDQSKYSGFIKVAQSFKNAAGLAFEHEYFNAAGVLIIHSAIAFADSISINFSSLKIKGDSHYDVISLLNQVIPANLGLSPRQYLSLSTLQKWFCLSLLDRKE